VSAAEHLDQRPLLVFFHEPTCGRCRRTDGFIAQVLQHRANYDTFRLRHVDIQQRPDLRERFQINTLPTLVVVDEGTVKARLTTPRGCTEIQGLLRPWLR
jgi:thioredoxin 1